MWGLIPDDLGDWLDGLRTHRVDVSLPKFEMTTSFGLAGVLQNMGNDRPLRRQRSRSVGHR